MNRANYGFALAVFCNKMTVIKTLKKIPMKKLHQNAIPWLAKLFIASTMVTAIYESSPFWNKFLKIN